MFQDWGGVVSPEQAVFNPLAGGDGRKKCMVTVKFVNWVKFSLLNSVAARTFTEFLSETISRVTG